MYTWIIRTGNTIKKKIELKYEVKIFLGSVKMFL